jgi:histidinol phosphatase-like PHP family hydrolase
MWIDGVCPVSVMTSSAKLDASAVAALLREFGQRTALRDGNPDAHSTDELDLTHWGVEMARKGGVPAGRILNALTLPQISSYFRERQRVPERTA